MTYEELEAARERICNADEDTKRRRAAKLATRIAALLSENHAPNAADWERGATKARKDAGIE